MPGRGAGAGWGRDPLEIIAGSRTMILGQTGTGKSELAKSMAAAAMSNGWQVIAVDSKDEMDLPGSVVVSSPMEIEDFQTWKRDIPIPAVRRWRLPWDRSVSVQQEEQVNPAPLLYHFKPGPETLGNPDLLDDLWWYIYKRKNTVVWLDECYMVTKGSRQDTCPTGLIALFTQGRSRNITIIACCQRPRNIPGVFLSEAGRIACFDLSGEDDRERVGELSHPAMSERMAEVCRKNNVEFTGHEFLFWSRGPGIMPEIRRLEL